jgi:hypothetical protein
MSDASQILATQLQGQLATPSAWLIGTTYVAGAAVTRSGLNYYAVQGSTGVDPAGDDGSTWGLLTGNGPQPSTMTALYQALTTGTAAMNQIRINRRIGLLNTATGSRWNMLIGGSGVGDVAQNFTECRETANLYGTLQGFGTAIASINPSDGRGGISRGILANIPQANIVSMANSLVAFTALYEGLEVETLPA